MLDKDKKIDVVVILLLISNAILGIFFFDALREQLTNPITAGLVMIGAFTIFDVIILYLISKQT